MDNDKFQELVLQQFSKVFEKIDSMDSRLKAVERGQLRFETRMENEVIDKIKILFDADKARNDKLNQVIDKLHSIEIDTGYLVSKVARLEKMAK